MAVTIKLHGNKELEKVLNGLHRKAVPIAVRNSLNDMAFESMREWKRNMRNEFTLRNTFTERSVAVVKAKGTDVQNMESRVGSKAEYMDTQEMGGIKRNKPWADSAPIATGYSAGQEGRKPRTKLPIHGMALRQIKEVWKGSGRNETMRNRVAIRRAMQARTRKPFLYMELNNGKTKGLFRIPSTRKNRFGVEVPNKLKMVHNLSKSSYRIPKTPTLQPALVGAEHKLSRLYASRLRQQVRRQMSFKAKGRVIL